MRKLSLPLTLLAIVLGCTLLSISAQAQLRVFVGRSGSDANPCTFALPCLTAQHAHDVMPAGGEIRMLDPGAYGTLTITKSVTVHGDGYGGLGNNAAVSAVTVAAGVSDTIALRGLIINGFGVGLTGVVINSGGSVVVDNCVIENFTSAGILLAVYLALVLDRFVHCPLCEFAAAPEAGKGDGKE